MVTIGVLYSLSFTNIRKELGFFHFKTAKTRIAKKDITCSLSSKLTKYEEFC